MYFLNTTIGSSKQKGFTLIELMVVISIIGLLSTIVLTALSSARDRSRVAKAQSDMTQIIHAIIIAQQEQGKPLVSFAGDADYANGTTGCPTSQACIDKWTLALTEIQTATNGAVSGLTQLVKDPWGNVYSMDGNQSQSGAGSCLLYDSFSVIGHSIPLPDASSTVAGIQSIPLSPICP